MNAEQFESRRYDLMVTLNSWASGTQYVPSDAMAAALDRWADDFDHFKELARQSSDPFFCEKCDHLKWAMRNTSSQLRRERRLTRDLASGIGMMAVNIGRLTLG